MIDEGKLLIEALRSLRADLGLRVGFMVYDVEEPLSATIVYFFYIYINLYLNLYPRVNQGNLFVLQRCCRAIYLSDVTAPPLSLLI